MGEIPENFNFERNSSEAWFTCSVSDTLMPLYYNQTIILLLFLGMSIVCNDIILEWFCEMIVFHESVDMHGKLDLKKTN